jgi:hypothetical protein
VGKETNFKMITYIGYFTTKYDFITIDLIVDIGKFTQKLGLDH